MITILVAFAALSVTFSLGFIAGAWWAARARINGRAGTEVAMIEDDKESVRAPPAAVFYCLGQRF